MTFILRRYIMLEHHLSVGLGDERKSCSTAMAATRSRDVDVLSATIALAASYTTCETYGSWLTHTQSLAGRYQLITKIHVVLNTLI